MFSGEADPRSGFTLIEAAAAMAIVGVVVVAWMAAVAAQISSVSRASETLTAAALAQDRLSAVRLWLPEGEGRLPDSLRSGRFDAPLEAFAWTAEVEPTTRERSLRDVAVTVRWSDGRETLRTRIAARDDLPGLGEADGP